ncbi:hypothetical protein [Meiothermus granaticius]|uniref:Uncharacterized protein n=1 Tax=Meiothermus granaticius NBRC 107808 TaxID=1227551 RepID=A0A399F9Q4_9DEIN|nr:hypothetical protein [Meiothermus granaticius]RIH92968.1 hypothetical protein Mgrana_01091 [Meiothermus granaticius NBRC 107808]GEM86194.1 hypothetical protein MGR01S_08190 [Meiothermus granaticius NBRC 107808]
MEIPDYWLPRPEFRLSPELEGELEAVLASVPEGDWLPEDLSVPKWVFLNWLAESKDLLLHGSVDSDITAFEPRLPNAADDDEFSQQTAVFASSDGIWPMFYAILDRTRGPMRMLNSALRFELPNGTLSDTHYFFSISDHALAKKPWREGVVYVLPREGFVQQPPYRVQAWTVHDPHWASLKPVKPRAKLRVRPEDFPFLAQVRAHDDETLVRRFTTDPRGFPWLG